MPFPSLSRRSPRPEDSPSRFSALHSNVRSMIAASSVYSQSPVPSTHTTPKLPFRGFFRRPNSPPELPLAASAAVEEARDLTFSQSPLHPQHTAGSYQRVVARNSDDTAPAPPRPVHGRNTSYVDPETQQLADIIHGRAPRRTKPKKIRYRRAWIRRRNGNGNSMCWAFVRSKAARSKVLGCIISGLFLAVILTIYLCIAVMRPKVGQEVHVLFILVILCTTIFFCHCLIRLCMLAFRPPDNTPRIPNMAGPEGFRPIRPIPVRLARDEEAGEVELGSEPKEIESVKQPPPAYGLWRCSVRVDPNLIHWARADQVNPAHLSRAGLSPAHSRSPSGNNDSPNPNEHEEEITRGPRPPSYVSDDGVSYVVDAQARSFVPGSTTISHADSLPSEGYPRVGLGLSDVHPLFR